MLRSVPSAHNRDGSWCTAERAGFAPLRTPVLLESSFAFWSIESERASGRLVDLHASQVGTARGCFGFTEDPKIFNFYLSVQLGPLALSGRGECTLLRGDFPETGLNSLRCTVPLGSTSGVHTGGVLTTNTMSSKAAVGERTDPPGYVQASIATIRLWRRH